MASKNEADKKNLYIEIAELFPRHHTFKEIAAMFYRSGVIPAPENPWPDYEGSKYDYILEKLSSCEDTTEFLNNVVPEVFGRIDIEYPESETYRLVYAAAKLGYEVETVIDILPDEDGKDFPLEYRVLKPPAIDNEQPKISPTYLEEQPNYPNKINKLIRQVNSSTNNNNHDSAALTIRRLVFVSLVKHAKINQYEEQVLNDGDYKELSKILETVRQNCPDFSNQLQSRMRSVKWMGDDANHSYTWEADELEIESIKMILRTFLDTLFPESES